MHWIRSIEYQDANARLIAAAPELLEALRQYTDDHGGRSDIARLVRLLHDVRTGDSDASEKDIEQMQDDLLDALIAANEVSAAAIAKATGPYTDD